MILHSALQPILPRMLRQQLLRAPRSLALRLAPPAATRAAVRSVAISASRPNVTARPDAVAALSKSTFLQKRFLSSPAPEEARKIFVGNLAWRVSSEDLHSHFQQWGQIEDARVIMDRENPFRSRGFGFVTFSRPEDAQSAIDMNHDKEWQGRNIRVNLASQPPQRSSPPGGV